LFNDVIKARGLDGFFGHSKSKKEVLIMSGHTGILKVSIIVDVINDKALFFGMAIASNFSEHFRGLSREHGTIDDFDKTGLRWHLLI
jgi:hypothetical protein